MVQQRVLWIALVMTVPVALTAIAVSAAEDDLVGTYKLISDTRKDLDTGEVSYNFGKHPVGYIMYGNEGRMLAIVVSDDRPKPGHGQDPGSPDLMPRFLFFQKDPKRSQIPVQGVDPLDDIPAIIEVLLLR